MLVLNLFLGVGLGCALLVCILVGTLAVEDLFGKLENRTVHRFGAFCGLITSFLGTAAIIYTVVFMITVLTK